MPLNLKQLEAFIWVADLGSFRKAADRLNTTQPNISARIAGLEAVLGVSLMERDAGSVQVTTKGRDLLVHARAVLRGAEDMLEAARTSALIEGTLRLGVTELIVHTWLNDFLKALRDAYPGLSVELTVDMSSVLEKELSERGLDLALQNGPFQRQMTGQIAIGRYPSAWVAAPSLGLVGQVGIADLAQHPILTHARTTRLYTQTHAHFAARRDLPVRLVPSSNLSACLHMARNGMGVAALPMAMIRDEIAQGQLVEVAYDWQPDPLDFYARYDAERASAFVARAAQIAVTVASVG